MTGPSRQKISSASRTWAFRLPVVASGSCSAPNVAGMPVMPESFPASVVRPQGS